MKLKKKLFASFVTGTLVLSMIPMSAFAQDVTPAQDEAMATAEASDDRTAQPAASDVVTFADVQLQAYLNEIIGKDRKPDTPITKAEMAGIKEVFINRDGSSYQISDLEGLQYAVNLETISLEDPKSATGERIAIKGLDTLKSLDKMSNIVIKNCNAVEDLTFLGNKPNLIKLTVGGCKNLKSVNGLSKQTTPALKILGISRNRALSDISALGNNALTQLEEIKIDLTGITDITPLKGYTSLKKADFEQIDITDANRTEYIDTVKSLTGLTELMMPYCNIKDSDTVMFEPLDKLETLVLNMNELTNVDFCKNLPSSLKTLGLHGNDISDMNAISRFSDLSVLGMGDCGVFDFRFLSKLDNLTNRGIRHAEGEKDFPMRETVVVTVKATDIKDDKIVVKNPYIDVDGSPISFEGATVPNDAEILKATPTEIELKLVNVQNGKTYYVTKEGFLLRLNTGESKISNLTIVVKIKGNPVHKHTWGDVTYTWSDDNMTCTAKRVCNDNTSHVETVAATVKSKVVTPATCTAKGKTEYTATFTEDWAAEQKKTVEDIAMLDHDYDTKWSSDANSHWHACKACGEKADSKAHDLKWVVDKEATQDAAGSKHQECSVCGFKLDSVEIPMIEKPAPPTKPEPPAEPKPPVIPQPPAKPEPPKAPATGDNANIMLLSMIGLSAASLLGAVIARRKKEFK